MSEMDNLISEAEEAISAVFSNQEVSQSETAEALSELKGYIDTMLDTLN